MSTSPHKNWKGCAMCDQHKHRGQWKERLPMSVKRATGKIRRGNRRDLGDQAA